MAKKIGIFILLAIATLGAVAVLLYLCFTKAWPLVPCQIAVGVLAYPNARQLYNWLLNDEA